jgi:signal transduction histidine kinase
VEVTFDLRDRRLRLGVRDDGAGFRPGEAEGPSAGQDGLANMRRRAADLGATLRVDSTPGGGTRVELEVPV